MTVSQLAAAEVEALRAQPFTYAAVGATAAFDPPPGFAFIRATRRLARSDFDAAARDLLSWRVHRRAGLRVAASSPTVTADAVVVMRLGWPPLGLRIPCRVVYVVDRPDAQGFAYGTLPGHPEVGEESFLVTRRADGQVEFTISTFSKPASRAARLGGPVSRWAQAVMTRRYLRALDS